MATRNYNNLKAINSWAGVQKINTDSSYGGGDWEILNQKEMLQDLLVLEVDRLLRCVIAAVDLEQLPTNAKDISHLHFCIFIVVCCALGHHCCFLTKTT